MTPTRHWRTLLWLMLIALALAVGGAQLIGLQADWLDMLHGMREKPNMLLLATVVYALCLAIPYVPGVELGLMLMIVFGRPGILMAYGGTVTGLTLAFLVGWFCRHHFVGNSLVNSWRVRARTFRQDSDQQLKNSRIGAWLQVRLVRFQAGYPYLLVAILFNLPGNWLIGGGGGIALMSGLSGRLHSLPFLLTVASATCLLPILAWFGLVELERWLPTRT